MQDFLGFKQKAGQIAFFLKQHDDFALVYHFDADGISACAIIAKALDGIGKKYAAMHLKQLYEHLAPEIKKLGAKHFVFIDFGSGQLEWLPKHFPNFCIIDHHQLATKKPVFPLHLNPMLFGFDGAQELSASGAAYFVAKAIDEKNSGLSALAIVGAVGDMQEQRSGKLSGLNRKILEDAVSTKVASVEGGLRLFGRNSRPLTQFLSYSTSPIIPEITGNEQNAAQFIESLNIPLKQQGRWRTFAMLSPEEQKKLSTALVAHLSAHNAPEWKIKSLFGENYTLLQEPLTSPTSDAKEFATLLNSNGRHGEAGLGLKVCIGDRARHYQKSVALLEQHRRQLADGINFVQEQGVVEEKKFYYFDAGTRISESIVGIVAGMLYSSVLLGSEKPVLGFASAQGNTLKISARATQELVRSGTNLGAALKNVCKELGGISSGGGHTIAAGCMIEAEKKQKFLELLDQKL